MARDNICQLSDFFLATVHRRLLCITDSFRSGAHNFETPLTHVSNARRVPMPAFKIYFRHTRVSSRKVSQPTERNIFLFPISTGFNIRLTNMISGLRWSLQFPRLVVRMNIPTDMLGITEDEVALSCHLIHFWQNDGEFERGVIAQALAQGPHREE